MNNWVLSTTTTTTTVNANEYRTQAKVGKMREK
jgi:hypothetical protein